MILEATLRPIDNQESVSFSKDSSPYKSLKSIEQEQYSVATVAVVVALTTNTTKNIKIPSRMSPIIPPRDTKR
jgi:hypothetical protein